VISFLFASVAMRAQPQIGAMPLLESLPPGGKCERFSRNAEMERLGEARMVQFSAGSPRRTIMVGVDSLERPKHLTVMAGRPLSPSKSENETLIAMFSGAGRVVSGNRMYGTLGTPARTSEDRRGGLLVADTARLLPLAKAVMTRCGR
jgi:hypothetical protein